MKTNFLTLIFWAISSALLAQPTLEWTNSLGGSQTDRGMSIEQIVGDGFVFAGSTRSEDGEVSSNNGGTDCWVAQLNSNYSLDWEKSFGGSGNERANAILKTPDGGFIFVGTSNSTDGNLTANNGESDIWVVKLNATGTIVWQKSIGGTGFDSGESIALTSDLSYVVVGQSSSNDMDFSGNNGGADVAVVKLNSAGNIVWTKSLGGTGSEEASSVKQTTDGGFIIAGWSESNDGDVSGNHGYGDCWVVKLNASGVIEWQKSLGGTVGEAARDIKQTTDGGYIFTGYTSSNDGDVSGNHAEFYDDNWVVKLSSTGTLEWQKCLGSTDDDGAYSVIQTNDGGFVVAGTLTDIVDDTQDMLITKLTASGSQAWQRTVGGNAGDQPGEVEQTPDGGLVIVGFSNSTGGDISTVQGNDDVVLVRLAALNAGIEDIANNVDIQLFPNPSTGSVQIRLKHLGQTDLSWSIYDGLGKIVQSGATHFNGVWTKNLNLENLPKGIYSARFYLDDVQVSRKVVVE